jgi:hypothetical protein
MRLSGRTRVANFARDHLYLINYQHQLASDSAPVLTVSLDSLVSVVYYLQLLQHIYACLSRQIKDFDSQRPVLARTGPRTGPVLCQRPDRTSETLGEMEVMNDADSLL